MVCAPLVDLSLCKQGPCVAGGSRARSCAPNGGRGVECVPPVQNDNQGAFEKKWGSTLNFSIEDIELTSFMRCFLDLLKHIPTSSSSLNNFTPWSMTGYLHHSFWTSRSQAGHINVF